MDRLGVVHGIYIPSQMGKNAVDFLRYTETVDNFPMAAINDPSQNSIDSLLQEWIGMTERDIAIALSEALYYI